MGQVTTAVSTRSTRKNHLVGGHDTHHMGDAYPGLRIAWRARQNRIAARLNQTCADTSSKETSIQVVA
nr:hypothetical protein [Kibdelosporangium sp. MJ126-NF4]CTQ93600.1 hypothetical protein [Kibdelosporangium sp. MJ126-NF4]